MSHPTIDPVRLEKAQNLLGLNRDVVVFLGVEDKLAPAGSYQGIPETWDEHLILLPMIDDPIELNFRLWHELAHAKQGEEYARSSYGSKTFMEHYNEQMIAAGFDLDQYLTNGHANFTDDDIDRYNTIPLEAEANKIASQYDDLYQLVIWE